jgi:prepilin-type N-terminal cleavage/methylation domain-containing protein
MGYFRQRKSKDAGFTIVELLIVIIVIAILSTLAIVSYNGIKIRAQTAVVQTDLDGAAKTLEIYKNGTSSTITYPPDLATANLKSSSGTIFQYTYTSSTNSYCLSATNGSIAYNITSSSNVPTSGVCPGDSPPGGYTPPTGWSSIASGGVHSCGIYTGKIYCWGANTWGQLGDGTNTTSTVPVAVVTTGALSGKTMASVYASGNNSCALSIDGLAYCWGYNAQGMLGNGTTTNTNTPVAVTTSGVLSGKTISSLALGGLDTCALASGQVYCWGYNGFGEVGDSTTIQRTTAVAVNTSGALSGKTVVAIGGGSFSNCAATSDGNAYCWGDNANGRLGNNSTTDAYSPVAVDKTGVLSGKSVTQVIAGATACAIASGAAYCWGAGTAGQLGNNSSADSWVPVAVSTAGVLSGKTIDAISNYYDTCVLSGGKPYCWGQAGSGQLGNNQSFASSIPVATTTTGVLSGVTLTMIANGGDHNCAAYSGGAYCWGANNAPGGELGNGTSGGSSSNPVQVSGP